MRKTHSKQGISEHQQATMEADLNTAETLRISTTETALTRAAEINN